MDEANVHTWMLDGAALRKAGKTQAPSRASEAVRATWADDDEAAEEGL
jgi:hypothetical protein